MQLTGILAGAEAAKKVKDASPDFDPRDQSTITEECLRMTRAAFETAAKNISRFEVISVKNAVPGVELTNEQAETLIRAYIEASVKESQ